VLIVRAILATTAALLAALTLAACSGGDTVSLESVADAATRTESPARRAWRW
jgi:hypothetical protein